MEKERNFQFARVLTLQDISEINRALGILVGLSYGINDCGIADGIANAIERIESVVNKED